MSPSDWFSWEFWVETAHSVLSGMGGSWVWARYAVNRENIISLATLIGGAIGFWWVIKRMRAAEKTAEAALKQVETAAKRHGEQTTADRERRITESFATLVEQLGSDKLETRLGGIYTLERISQEKESEREYWPIM